MHLSAMKKVGNDRNVIVKCTSVADVLTGDKPHLFSSHQSFKLHLIFPIHIHHISFIIQNYKCSSFSVPQEEATLLGTSLNCVQQISKYHNEREKS